MTTGTASAQRSPRSEPEGSSSFPTDTVYGLAADGESEAAALALYAAKGRDAIQPTALLLASVEELLAPRAGAAGGRRADGPRAAARAR